MNKDFVYNPYTKIYFGENKELEIGEILNSYHFHNVLILIGMGSVKKSGLLDRVIEVLNQQHISYHILSNIRPNPTIESVKEGLKLARQYQVDCLLPIGGGSVIDTAKCIAVNYEYDGDPFDFNLHKVKPTKALPIGAITTIAAAGSECSTSCVIQDDEKQIKQGFNSEIVRPIFVIENPYLTMTTPKEQTNYGVVDILMHTLERYFCPSDEIEFADYIAEGLIKAVIEAGKVVNKDPNDYQARATLLLASSFSHNGLTNVGKSYTMPVHKLEHVISAVYPNVAHAAGLALLFPRWAKQYVDVYVDKFAKFSKNVFNINEKDQALQARKGIQLLTQFFYELGMPKTFKDLSIDDINVDLLVQQFAVLSTPKVAKEKKPLDEKVAREIYQSCIMEEINL